MSDTSLSAPKPLLPALGAVTEALTPLADPLIRVATGLFLLPHGAQKLFGWFGGYGIAGTGEFFVSLGLPASLAVVAGVIELGGGLLLTLGLATRAAAALVVALMAVAIVQVHLVNGFFWTDGGYEYPLLWGVLALSIAIRGGGRFSLDAAIGREI